MKIHKRAAEFIAYFFTIFWIFYPYIKEVAVRDELAFQFRTLWDYLKGIVTYSNIIESIMTKPVYIGYMLVLIINIGFIIYKTKKHS